MDSRVDDESHFRLDRRAFSVGALTDPSDAREYWAGKTPEERLEALEFLRQTMYGYDPSTERLQRVLEIIERPVR